MSPTTLSNTNGSDAVTIVESDHILWTLAWATSGQEVVIHIFAHQFGDRFRHVGSATEVALLLSAAHPGVSITSRERVGQSNRACVRTAMAIGANFAIVESKILGFLVNSHSFFTFVPVGLIQVAEFIF
ncbi:MAG: hypothetical protein GY696_00560 [Gammaproteobacteria bacterium]|nr:hypothetical protein [Gammaproteobacteria bacterium]